MPPCTYEIGECLVHGLGLRDLGARFPHRVAYHAVVGPAAFRADLHHVLAEARHAPYLVFVCGPSRTAHIELTVTLGVHGPQQLQVWVL